MEVNEVKKELKKINSRIKILSDARMEVPKELYDRKRRLEDMIDKWKTTN